MTVAFPAAPDSVRSPLRPSRGDVAVLAYAALYLAANAFVTPGPSWLRSSVIVAFFGINVVTMGAQLQLARSDAFDRRTRWAWALLAASSAGIAVGGIVWTAWKITNPAAPEPAWSTWLTSSYMPLAIAGFLTFPREPRVSWRDRRLLLDGALLAVAGLTLSWHFSIQGLFDGTTPRTVETFVTNVAEWLVFVAASIAFLRSRSRVTRTAISIALVALVSFVLADFLWQTDASSYHPGDPIDMYWFATWIVRWIAARYAWHASARARAHGDDDSDVPYRSGIAPTAFVGSSYLLLVVVVLQAQNDREAAAIGLITTVMTILLVVRQRVELADNQRLAHATLAQAERFRALLSHASDYVAVLDQNLSLRWASPSFATMSALPPGAPFTELVHPDDRTAVTRWLTGGTPRGNSLPLTCRLRAADASWSDVELRVEDRRDDPNVHGLIVNGRDVSGERSLEGRLRHAEKLVTLHDIAGRIAHAFNNLLAMIAGHAELLAAELHEHPRARDDVAAIRAATDRGAGITRQLLGFSGRHVIQPVRLPVASAIEAVIPSLDRALPGGTHIELALGDRGAHVLFDRAQFEQVLLNLVANARDAMPDGGVITVSAAIEQSDEASADGAPATGVVVRVRDAGIGIPEDDLRHIFEPFFTTKAPGLGTGLGLAMVDTIVRRAGGRVSVESGVGIGTTVAIHLPLARAATPVMTMAVPDAPEPTGRGVVLLVDDEAGVRRLSRRMLERAGYGVIEASGGAEAIAIAEDLALRIDILVTDMMMPKVSGRDVIARFTVIRPGTPIIVVTGFAAEQERGKPLAPEVRSIVAKPFSAAIYLRAVSNALGAADDEPR